jgi:hypothetical protein
MRLDRVLDLRRQQVQLGTLARRLEQFHLVPHHRTGVDRPVVLRLIDEVDAAGVDRLVRRDRPEVWVDRVADLGVDRASTVDGLEAAVLLGEILQHPELWKQLIDSLVADVVFPRRGDKLSVIDVCHWQLLRG